MTAPAETSVVRLPDDMEDDSGLAMGEHSGAV